METFRCPCCEEDVPANRRAKISEGKTPICEACARDLFCGPEDYN